MNFEFGVSAHESVLRYYFFLLKMTTTTIGPFTPTISCEDTIDMLDTHVVYNGVRRGGVGEHDVPPMPDDKLHAFEGKTVQLLSKTSKQYLRMLDSGFVVVCAEPMLSMTCL